MLDLINTQSTCCRYVYTPADIQRMVVKRRQEKGGVNVAIEKARLQRERDYAQQTGDFASVAEYAALACDCTASFCKGAAAALHCVSMLLSFGLQE